MTSHTRAYAQRLRVFGRNTDECLFDKRLRVPSQKFQLLPLFGGKGPTPLHEYASATCAATTRKAWGLMPDTISQQKPPCMGLSVCLAAALLPQQPGCSLFCRSLPPQN